MAREAGGSVLNARKVWGRSGFSILFTLVGIFFLLDGDERVVLLTFMSIFVFCLVKGCFVNGGRGCFSTAGVSKIYFVMVTTIGHHKEMLLAKIQNLF